MSLRQLSLSCLRAQLSRGTRVDAERTTEKVEQCLRRMLFKLRLLPISLSVPVAASQVRQLIFRLCGNERKMRTGSATGGSSTKSGNSVEASSRRYEGIPCSSSAKSSPSASSSVHRSLNMSQGSRVGSWSPSRGGSGQAHQLPSRLRRLRPALRTSSTLTLALRSPDRSNLPYRSAFAVESSKDGCASAGEGIEERRANGLVRSPRSCRR